MERNRDLVRFILIEVETKGGPLAGLEKNPEIEGYTSDQIGYHVGLLVNEGYLTGVDATTMRATSPQYFAIKLTNKGHDLLSAIKNAEG